MNQKLWEECIAFHGHTCPGLATGYRVGIAALEFFGEDMKNNHDEDVVCVTENDSCAVDAVQWMTGCTVGKGNLLFHTTGKMAFTFYSRKSGKEIRILPVKKDNDMSREERIKWILTVPQEELLLIRQPRFDMPERARNFKGVACEICGETAAENHIHLRDGKFVCDDCCDGYTRGW